MIVRTAGYVDAYRAWAKYGKDIHLLAGRGGDQRQTVFVNERILAEVQVQENDVLADVGCGDGWLLKHAPRCSEKIGISATEEEASRLRENGLQVFAASADRLPLPAESASLIICNSVLLIVPPARVPGCLREFCRVAKSGARIWLGEIPIQQEWSESGYSSASAKLLQFLRNRQLRAGARFLGRIFLAAVRRQPFILSTVPLNQFHMAPKEFIALAETSGLRLDRQLPHSQLDAGGGVITSASRYDYLFLKP